ncbi:TetR family transcriptional regulator [Nonomuraea sp. NBC_00507]|uniref:TetR family transcriptional regulator n=1 Tax=Nonomuraea sp. NBC_00507 TaxID=2976002 RepID=UPI002E182002
MRRTAEEAAETRKALLRAALAVFSERGYAAATLAGIAERAGVTRGAAYHHFHDKAALYLATISELWAEAAAPVWGTLDGDEPVMERMRRFLVAFFTALERDATLRQAFALSMRSAEGLPELETGLRDKRIMMEGWKRGLMELLAGAGLRDEVSAEAAALTIITSVNGTAATWLACPDLFSPADQAEALADAVLCGITR